MVVVVAKEFKHYMEEHEVYTVEDLISMRNFGGFPNYVVSTAIWCISWRISAKGCTHPCRFSIVSYGPICIRASLHWILTMMLFI